MARSNFISVLLLTVRRIDVAFVSHVKNTSTGVLFMAFMAGKARQCWSYHNFRLDIEANI
jgi:hypothetical protein